MIRIVLAVILIVVFLVSTLPVAELLGAQERPPQPCRIKTDPLWIGVASFFIPGLGQFFNGDDKKGFTHLVVALAAPTAIYIVSALFPLGDIATLAAPLFYFGWGLYSAMDAHEVASKYCRP